MPLSLVSRIGLDTLGKLEDAARRRYAEAGLLIESEPLGAIYLLGYAIEMRLKGACYRVAGLTPTTLLNDGKPSPRKQAEARICELLNLPRGLPVGHNLRGWATLLEKRRADNALLGALPPALAADMNRHVDKVIRCWTVDIRYRANRPYDVELQAMMAAARWFRSHYRQLWS